MRTTSYNRLMTMSHPLSQDTCPECYKDTPSHKLEDVLTLDEGFMLIHEFINVKTFVYQSLPTDDKKECCFAMIQLHGPLHVALDSRPPWDAFKFGKKN